MKRDQTSSDFFFNTTSLLTDIYFISDSWTWVFNEEETVEEDYSFSSLFVFLTLLQTWKRNLYQTSDSWSFDFIYRAADMIEKEKI